MKKAFIVIVVFTAIVFVSMFLFLRFFDFNHFRDGLAKHLTDATGRVVEIGEINLDFDLTRGVFLSVKNVSLSEDPQFSTEPFFLSKSIQLGLKIFPLLKKQIEVTHLEFVEPVFRLIILQDGRKNIDSLIGNLTRKSARVESGFWIRNAEASDTGTLGGSSDVKRGIDERGALDLSLNIKTLRIDSGFVSLMHQNPNGMHHLIFSNLDFFLDNFSFGTKAPFRLKTGVLSSTENLSASGMVTVSLPQSVRLDDVVVQFDAANAQIMDYLTPMFPILKEWDIKKTVQGNLQVNIPQFMMDDQGELAFSANGYLRDGKVDVGKVGQRISDVGAEFSCTEHDIEIKKMSANLNTGTVFMSGQVREYLKTPAVFMNVKMSGVEVQDFLRDVKLPFSVYGQINGDADIQMDQGMPLKGGDGLIRVDGAKFQDFNLLKFIMGQFNFIPDFYQKVYDGLPREYKETLRLKDTIFDIVEMNVGFADNKIKMDRIQIVTSGVELLGKAAIGLDQHLDMKADLFLDQKFSQSLLKSEEDLSFLLENGKIKIPFVPFSGSMAQIGMIRPDFSQLVKMYYEKQGKQKLKDVIFDALDIPKDQTASPDGSGSGDPNDLNEDGSAVRPEEILIENILDKIFK